MGDDDWNVVMRKKHGSRTKEDELAKISVSIFVTNFPETCSAKDLFQTCKVFGHVVDSYIPLKRSQSGKRFGFVRFINVFSVERLISNLCTLWIGKHKLHANIPRFQRSSVNAKASAPIGGSAQPVRKGVKDPLLNNQNAYGNSGRSSHSSYSGPKPKAHTGSYANAVNEAHGSMLSPSPALVLDDSCLVERDLSRHVMGKVKDFSAIPNLSTIFSDEGFYGTKLTYMGGMWVMIELDKVDTKETLKNHSGVKSWFLDIKDAVEDFVSEDRIVWMDIEGVPLKAWSRETFIKIGKKWGETLDLEDNTATSFGRKRICIRTNHATSIFESFKIIVKGRVYMVRAKELFTWNPIFMIHKEKDYNSDVESVIEPINNNDNEEDLDDDYASDVNDVPETVFGTNSSSNIQGNGPVAVQQSDDPFGLYDLMNKKKTREISEPSPSLTHPPGFTPEFLEKQNAVEDKNSLEFLNAKVMTSSQEIPTVDHNDQTSQKETNCGGSVLGVMEDVIRVGQAMGYSMEGCVKDLAAIIDNQGDANNSLGKRRILDYEQQMTRIVAWCLGFMKWVSEDPSYVTGGEPEYPQELFSAVDLLFLQFLVRSPTLDSANSCVMQGASCTQRKVSMVSFSRISPNNFLSSILLVVVIIVTVVIVMVILIVVVFAIVGVVIVVAIFGVWAYAFHQDKASLVRVPVVNVTLSSSAHLLRENTDSFPLFATGISLGPVFLLGLSAFAIAACASRAAVIPSVMSCWMAAKVMAGVSDVDERITEKRDEKTKPNDKPDRTGKDCEDKAKSKPKKCGFGGLARMPPKRTSTSKTPAITLAAIQQLITDGIIAALEAQATTMANADNPNRKHCKCAKEVRVTFATDATCITQELCTVKWRNSDQKLLETKRSSSETTLLRILSYKDWTLLFVIEQLMAWSGMDMKMAKTCYHSHCSSSKGIVAIVNKLGNLGRDMKKLKENVHAIQVGCQTCEGAYLDKECPLNEEVMWKPSSGEKRPSLTKIINKYIEEASKRQAKQDEWLKKFYQSTEANRETHDKIIQGLEGKEIEYFYANSGFSDNEEEETDDSGMAEAVAALEATLKKKREEPKKVKQNVN
ncbi:RNA-directed DNA polymerase, eukaryota [Tanacetum coccineum]|uniref:RNA-directed DNA polymerase, eukaryota n=1 Tax=Tanacetum coccineum TaxID=301880 RepID=A0ABQ4ZUT0_9ASTR